MIVTHGNGPQVGVLALQDAAVPGVGNFPLDILGAGTTGMIGYMVAQEFRNKLPGRQVAMLLTQIEVDPKDSAFGRPTKPIGPVYTEEEAKTLAAERGWTIAPDGKGFRRVVPSPKPIRILEVDSLRLLVGAGVVVICAGGGGIPVVFDERGNVRGVEAVIEKDLSAGLVARDVAADALLLLTDADGVMLDWGSPSERRLERATPEEILAYEFPEGSMGPKVQAAAAFVSKTGGIAGIGRLEDASEILVGKAGTLIVPGDAGGT
jgi:carbamate kinase